MKKCNIKQKRFILTWPTDFHKIIHLSAVMNNESINKWVLRAALEQLAKERSYHIFKAHD